VVPQTVDQGRSVVRGSVGRGEADPGKGIGKQWQFGLLRKSVNTEYGNSWKERDEITGRRLTGTGGEDALTRPVLEGALNLKPLRNMLMWIKNEPERLLGLLEMGYVRNGAGG
jgi:hypothetical protein